MRHAVRLLGGLEQHLRPRPVDPFQLVDRQPVLRVAVIERDGQLLRTGIVPPLGEQSADRRRGRAVRGSRNPLLAARSGQRDVVGQAQPEPAAHRPDFVLAVGVERGITQLVPRRRTREDDLVLPAVVRHDQLAPFVFRRQGDHQRGDHPIELLAVAMRQEEAALFVHEQLVEVGRQLAVFEPQGPLHVLEDGSDEIVPLRVGQLKLAGVEFPNAPHVGIDHRFRPLAIRCLAAELDQFAGLRRPQRQPHGAQPADFQSWHRQRPIAPGTDFARPIHLTQRVEELVVNARLVRWSLPCRTPM